MCVCECVCVSVCVCVCVLSSVDFYYVEIIVIKFKDMQTI